MAITGVQLLGIKIKGFFYLVFSIISIILGGIINASMTATKIFTETILKDKLDGFLDSLLFWAGFKSVELTSMDMIGVMGKMVESTPVIIKAFIIGGLVGLGSWILFAEIMGFILRRAFKKDN